MIGDRSGVEVWAAITAVVAIDDDDRVRNEVVLLERVTVQRDALGDAERRESAEQEGRAEPSQAAHRL